MLANEMKELASKSRNENEEDFNNGKNMATLVVTYEKVEE